MRARFTRAGNAKRCAGRWGYCLRTLKCLRLLATSAVSPLAVAATLAPLPTWAAEPASPARLACDNRDCICAAAAHECAATSANFTVRSYVAGPQAAAVARRCEHICAELRSQVFGIAPGTRWQPRCAVVLHATRDAYHRAVGDAAAQTVGSSTVSFSGGRVAARRIDLFTERPDESLAAVPHELVHILFADAFPTTAPPKWAEEGLALSLDSPAKRARHEQDLAAAMRSGTMLPLNRLLADADYPAAPQRAAFYAQSLSLVDYLTHQEPPQEFLRYVKLSTERGHSRALAAVYGLEEAELDRRWQEHLAAATPIRLPSN